MASLVLFRCCYCISLLFPVYCSYLLLKVKILLIFTIGASNSPVQPASREGEGEGGAGSAAWFGVVSVGTLNWRVPFVNYNKILLKMGTRVLVLTT